VPAAVPVYNNEKPLPILVDCLHRVSPAGRRRLESILADGRSRDHSARIHSRIMDRSSYTAETTTDRREYAAN
jgi:hypothetical protein